MDRRILIFLVLVPLLSLAFKDSDIAKPLVANQTSADWAVEINIPKGASREESLAIAAEVAEEHGLQLIGRIGELDHFYLMRSRGILSLQQIEEHSHATSKSLGANHKIVWFQKQAIKQHRTRFDLPTDPLFVRQWHLKNDANKVDLNVVPAWESGATGKGAVIAIVDDGLQHTHPDLQGNYLSALSRNWNDGNSGDPSPNVANGDFHGTACAGAAAAVRDGKVCGVGVAYEASLAGLRLISDVVNDATEASAMNWKFQDIDIYSCSWGPTDDGARLEKPGRLLELALEKGITEGRKGKGSIFVWAAGNGASKGDNCNYDGYANSPFTIAIGAVTYNGGYPYYSEKCAALIGVAPSSGGSLGIVTTDLFGNDGYSYDNCDTSFGGTSAAAPQIAGVVALMLQARPDLGWKDVQHILINTAKIVDPNDRDWTKNGRGYSISHKYGFGLIDAGAAVKLARDWELKGGAIAFVDSGVVSVNKVIPDYDPTKADFALVETWEVAEDLEVEHVVVTFTADHPIGTDLEVILQSPNGTNSTLAELHGFIPNYVVQISAPSAIAGTVTCSSANFGPDLKSFPLGVSGEVVLASPLDGCQELENDMSGKICFVKRGTCDFTKKVKNCQNKGAIGVIVGNDKDGSTSSMGGDDSSIVIPSVMVKSDASTNIQRQINIGQSVQVTLKFSITKTIDKIIYNDWPFTTTRNWGESSKGTWKLFVADKWNDGSNQAGKFTSWRLQVFHDGPRKPYNPTGTGTPVVVKAVIILALLGFVGVVVGILVWKIRNKSQQASTLHYATVELGDEGDVGASINSPSINGEDQEIDLSDDINQHN